MKIIGGIFALSALVFGFVGFSVWTIETAGASDIKASKYPTEPGACWSILTFNEELACETRNDYGDSRNAPGTTVLSSCWVNRHLQVNLVIENATNVYKTPCPQ